MKRDKYKIFAIIMLIIELLSIFGNFSLSFANIKEGDNILLKGDHECDSLLEYWMSDYKRWSYKVVWYVYYTDPEDGARYPAFCIEPQKQGVGTGYDSYTTSISRENDNRIWRILNKGYMGSSYQEWNLECDDDFYSATKVALHSLAEGIAPKDKYILGNRSVDGNSVEEIQRRGAKVLEVAQNLYEYGLNGSEVYTAPSVSVSKQGEGKIENIQNNSYYVQNYSVTANKYLKSYNIEINNFPSGTKILDSKNQETINLSENSFKIAIPTNQIENDINGTIYINNAQIKTNPVFYCKSSVAQAQSYVTYTSGYELSNTSINMEVKANQSNLQITKIDKETKMPIANVKFKVQDTNGNEIAQVTTDKSGIATLSNIAPQIVTIKEISVPEPYVLSDEEKQVELKWKETSKVTFENERKKGNLKILKVDADNNEIVLENVEFELLDSNGKVVKTLITNEKGEAYANNLEIGKYTLRETKTKENYVLSEDEIKVEVKYGQVETLQLENEKIKGQIKIVKISEDDNLRNGKPKGTPIQDVVFEIRKEDGEIIQTLTTNEEGIAISDKLEKGKYIMQEVKSNEDYQINEKEFLIEIVEDNKIEEITITNLSKKPEPKKLPRTGF